MRARRVRWRPRLPLVTGDTLTLVRSIVLVALVALSGCDLVFLGSETPTCFGFNGPFGGGLLDACVVPDQLPARLEVSSIDTANDCYDLIQQSDPGNTEVCLFAATNVTIQSELRVIGPRPLVLLATEMFVITNTGLVEASSKRTAGDGAGHFTSCGGGNGANTGNSGGGGGAGGSFGSVGGNGATGTSSAPAGLAAPASSRPGFLRGGCSGGSGGNSSNGGLGGEGGDGGGAVYLIAGTQIMISGRINASGAAGGGGLRDSSGRPSGAGGGGAGGLIAIDAPQIFIEASAIIIANGAGGGSGGSTSADGLAGSEPDLASMRPYLAAGGIAGAGAGGNGAAGTIAAGNGVVSGGGGGGGGGFTMLFAPSPMVSPDAWISPLPDGL
jgi:hypothetical protein